MSIKVRSLRKYLPRLMKSPKILDVLRYTVKDIKKLGSFRYSNMHFTQQISQP